MLTPEQLKKVKSELFKNSDTDTYAVIDGAACPELRFKIYDYQPEYACLWSGKLEPDLEEVAPYMVKLEKNSVFTEWLLSNGHDKHWNVLVESDLDKEPFRKQIRKLLLARTPNGDTIVFRFYDPRVLNLYINNSLSIDLVPFFTGVSRFLYFIDSKFLIVKSSCLLKDEKRATVEFCDFV